MFNIYSYHLTTIFTVLHFSLYLGTLFALYNVVGNRPKASAFRLFCKLVIIFKKIKK